MTSDTRPSVEDAMTHMTPRILSPARLRAVLAVALLAVLQTLAHAGSAAAQDGPAVLLFYDMEGVASVTSARAVSFGSPGYAAARAALTDEVNAVVRGLLRAGADRVVLTDGHGSGNPEPDYDVARLPEGASHDVRDAPYDAFVDAVGPEIDAVVAVGMHGRAGGEGFLAHTYFPHTRWRLAGLEMNESMILAASAARFGIPLILVSGDDVLHSEVEAFSPETRFVATKRGAGRREPEPRGRQDVLAELEAAAAEALRHADAVPTWSPPVSARPVSELSYTLPDHAAVAIHYPHARPVDDRTVALDADDFLEIGRAHV